ncbi:MAG: hypothetical protein B6I20_04145 [Bacteroidetes bacterium 4572_117]|nr:MAG: hypothetical protein B6I20_04145 [Bacteroidetes bacterium 4572_117]
MGGESVYLFNKDSILVDSVFFPKQAANISYGRIYGDIEQWRYFHEPSPQKTNPISGIEKLDFASKPVFSEKAGFYKKPFKLKLSVLQNTAKIHYTIDGSSPTQAKLPHNRTSLKKLLGFLLFH